MISPAPITCFGEALWDVLPTGRQPGGAPCNVALHLHRLGQPVRLISRVGDDELGRELRDFLVSRGLDSSLVQLSATHLTGVVKANIRAGHPEASYKIVKPLAWDYIQYSEVLRTAVSQSSILLYGSLAARSQVSRETLYRLLQHAPFKVFDLNLRPPHYSRQVVKYLLRQASLINLTEGELVEVMNWLDQPADVATALPWLVQHFDLQGVCLSRGAAGATLFTGGAWFHHAEISAAVKDPIGGGDAFLAALLASWNAGQSPAECLQRACAAGATAHGQHARSSVLTENDF